MINKHKLKTMIDLHEIESEALDQIKYLLSLSFIESLVFCPDIHAGYLMPIGGVGLFNNVISPYCVGYDIGCVDCDTEYLSPTGWKKIKNYNNEEIMSFDINTGKSKFDMPLRFIKENCLEFNEIKTKYGINQRISDDHTVLYVQNNKFKTTKAKDLVDKHNKLVLGFRGKFLTTFDPIINTSVDLTDEQLRVQIMCIADGNFSTNQCRLVFHKERKIKRAKKLLNAAKIKYTHRIYDKRNEFEFHAPIFSKSMKQLWKCSLDQLKIIVDEVFHWDGTLGTNNRGNIFFSKNKESIDFIQYACSSCGIRSTITTDIRKDGEIEYRVVCSKNIYVGIAGTPKNFIKKIKSEDGFKYCFTTKTGYWIMRREGNIVITGNCGMCVIVTNIFYADIEKEKYSIFYEIKQRIPMINRDRALRYPKFESATGNKDLNEKVNNKLCKQLGTLGSGNHFIEIGENLKGYLTITIHSGSRNIGKTIADYHIQVSNDCHKELPNSFLFLDSKEGKEYVQDLNFALEYALANRKTMMEIILEILGLDKSLMSRMINENHNHAIVRPDGKVLHRKGATPADLDQLGVIPGDMLAGTYITMGLGNEEYLSSASHGAGRVLSRNKAKKKFTVKEVEEQLKGIVCDIHPGMLDEAPDAYKDLDYVINKQEGLVIKAIDYFSPKIVVKG